MKDDNIFKQKLYAHTLPVNEGLWDKIESRLPPDKYRGRFPFFWLILFTSALLGGILMFGWIENTPEAHIPMTPSPPDTPAAFHDPVPSPAELIKTSEEEKISSFGSPNSLNTNSETISSRITTPTTGSITQKKSSGIYHSPDRPGIRSDALAGKTSTSSSSEGTTTQPETPVQISATIPSGNSEKSAFAAIPFLPFTETKFPEESLLSTVSITSGKPDPSCYKLSDNTSNYLFSLDFILGQGYSPRIFEDTGGESSIYAEARRATERHQYTWSAGARLNLHVRNGFTSSIGLLFQKTGDIFDYRDSLASKSTTRIDSFWSANGTFLYADTVRVFIPGTLIKKIHNSYRYLDIPLLVGYELPVGRSSLMIQVGPVLNLTSSHKGQILDPMLIPRPITSGSPGHLQVYKTSLGLSLYVGAGILFPLTDHLSVIFEPRYLHRMKPVTLPGYMLKEYRHSAGLNLGIRYHLL